MNFKKFITNGINFPENVLERLLRAGHLDLVGKFLSSTKSPVYLTSEIFEIFMTLTYEEKMDLLEYKKFYKPLFRLLADDYDCLFEFQQENIIHHLLGTDTFEAYWDIVPSMDVKIASIQAFERSSSIYFAGFKFALRLISLDSPKLREGFKKEKISWYTKVHHEYHWHIESIIKKDRTFDEFVWAMYLFRKAGVKGVENIRDVKHLIQGHPFKKDVLTYFGLYRGHVNRSLEFVCKINEVIM